jgi:hypothetical protein
MQQQVCRRPDLLDHLVGERKQLGWDFHPERLCSFEIDHQLKFL